MDPGLLPPGSALFPADRYCLSSGLGLKRPDVQLWPPPRCVTVCHARLGASAFLPGNGGIVGVASDTPGLLWLLLHFFLCLLLLMKSREDPGEELGQETL